MEVFRKLTDFDKSFPTEKSCLAYLEKMRWNGQVSSPYTGSVNIRQTGPFKYRCLDTDQKFSVKTGTLFEKKKSVIDRFKLYWLYNIEPGISSVQAAALLGLNQKTVYNIRQEMLAALQDNPEITMTEVQIDKEGWLKIDRVNIPVFVLAGGERAVCQNALYQFLVNKPGKSNLRHALGISKLRDRLPESMLQKEDIYGRFDGRTFKLFLADELLALCRAVILAGFRQELSLTWRRAYPGAQLLLSAFAEKGVISTIDEAIAHSPVMSRAEFDKLIRRLLGSNVTHSLQDFKR